MDRPEPKSAPTSHASSGDKDKAKATAPASGPAPAANSARPGVASAPQRPWLIRKRGSTENLSCPDLPALRQWIVERRIARDDEISRGGQRWRRMGSIVELESLFYSVEQERAQKRRNSGTLPAAPAPTPTAAASSSPRLTPVPAPVATTPGTGVPIARPVPVPGPAAAAEAKAPEPAPAKPAPAAPKPAEPAVTAKVEAPPAPAAASPPAEKKPTESSGVGPVKVTPPTGLAAAAGGLSPMRLARKDPNRGKPQAMPGMAGSVQAAMRAAGNQPAKPAQGAASAGGEAKKPEPASSAGRPALASANPPRAAGATPGKPAAGAAGKSGADKGGSATSGAQTVLFSRKDQDHDDHDDPDRTRKLPPADSRATERQPARPRDPVEEAILRNDPVPRHLKEAAESGDSVRRPSRDSQQTEYVKARDGSSSLRRTLFLALAVAAIGGGIWYYTQSGDTSTKPTPPAGEVTSPAPTPTEPSATRPATGTSETATPPTTGSTPPAPVAEPLPPSTGQATTGTPPPVPSTAAKPEPPKPEPPKSEPIKAEAPKPEPPKPVAVTPTPPPKPVAVTPPPTPAPTSPAKPAGATDPAAAKPTISLAELRQKIGEDIPKGFDDQMELAQRLVERYKYDSAQAMYEYMLSYASAVPAIHNGLGTCAFEKNRADEAIVHFRNALERRPSYSAAVFGLAKTYHRLKNDKEQALIYYKKYLELNPKGSAAQLSREAIAKLEGTPLPPPPSAPAP